MTSQKKTKRNKKSKLTKHQQNRNKNYAKQHAKINKFRGNYGNWAMIVLMFVASIQPHISTNVHYTNPVEIVDQMGNV